MISAVYQGDVVLTGQADTVTVPRIAVNYVVPYIIASVAYLSACRRA